MKKTTLVRWMLLIGGGFILFTIVLAQSNSLNFSYLDNPINDYPKAWKTIDSLVEKGLTRSALTKVEDLLKQAKVENRSEEVLRALIYRCRFVEELNEAGTLEVIKGLRAEVAEATGPVKALLQSITAQVFQHYLDREIWRIGQRTSTEFLPDDPATWSVAQLQQAIAELYLASTEDAATKTVPLSQYNNILEPLQGTEGRWPTLYDLLVNRAIVHFTNTKNSLSVPTNAFVLNQPAAFAPAATFAQTAFSSADQSSWLWRVIKLFQQALAFHLNDADPIALIDLDLHRLEFCQTHAVIEDKDVRYRQALELLQKQHAQRPIAAEIAFALAASWRALGNSYTPKEGTEATRLALKKALALADSASKKTPTTRGGLLCAQMVEELQIKSLTMEGEEVVLPNQPLLIKLSARNLPQLYCNLYQLNSEQRNRYLINNGDNPEELLKNLKPLRRWTQALPDDGDLQEHSTEIALEGLPLGHYVLFASDQAKLSSKDELKPAMVRFSVSSLAALSNNSEGGGTQFLLTHRGTGAPQAGVKATFFASSYDRQGRRYIDKTIGTATSNDQGMLRSNFPEQSFRVRFNLGADELFLENRYYDYPQREEPILSYEWTHFFLDRSIYRPGQTLYFKGIALQKTTGEKPLIQPNKEVIITLFDANRQEISRVTLQSNAYGTFHGAFTLPTDGLRGSFSLGSSCGGSQHSFRVEEYKRPTFAVSFAAPSGAPALDQTITVPGLAQGFAGNNLTGAKVSYRVTRSSTIDPWYRWLNPGFSFRPSPPTQVKIGETTTDGQGKFTVEFPATPERTAGRPLEAIFTVDATVTDITGETQSAAWSITLGPVGLKLNLEMAEQIDQAKTDTIKLSSKNLAGEFLPAQGELSIYALPGLSGPQLARYWPSPDRPTINASTFAKLFPHLPYQDLPETPDWRKLTPEVRLPFNTANDNKVVWPRNLTPGNYLVVASSRDPQGQEAWAIQSITTFNSSQQLAPARSILWARWTQAQQLPGETARLQLGSGTKELNVLLTTLRQDEVASQKWIRLVNWAEELQNITAADQGNIAVQLQAVWGNRVHALYLPLEVPYTNEKLNIEYLSFRDKLRPGQPEEWRLRITGPQGEKVAAEMAATLYDASLDQFTPHGWQLNLQPTYGRYLTNNWSSPTFSTNSSSLYRVSNRVKLPSWQYPSLNWFGYLYDYQMLSSRAPGMMASEMAVTRTIPTKSKGNRRSNESVAYAAMSAPEPAIAGDTELVLEKREELDLGTPEAPTPAPPRTPVLAPRTNLKETVFFFPELYTDEDGAVILKFTMNEALTRWKFLGLATTKDLKVGLTSRQIITQKELMVQPNAPRFLREGDEMVFTAKVSNLSGSSQSGTATLELVNPVDNQPVDQSFGLTTAVVPFTTEPGQSAPLAWKIKVPKGYLGALTYRVVATSGQFSDGEESTLPVLTNRQLVTETLPLFVPGKQTRTFTLASLLDPMPSPSRVNHRLSLEFTANPAWLAVKSLPYLMEYPYDCTEQVFSRYYANSLAAKVVQRNPRIAQVFNKWRNTPALQSNLRANEELKAVILAETPWVLEALSEEKQRAQIALLFDLDRLAAEKTANLAKLSQRQLPDGGWSWFPGGEANWYITQYIVAGMGHLDRLGAAPATDLGATLDRALAYLDQEALEYYQKLRERQQKAKTKLEDYQPEPLMVHYLYTRSFFAQPAPSKEVTTMQRFFRQQVERHWTKLGLYEQGMAALVLNRNDQVSVARQIVQSLQERALQSPELGMYWKYAQGYRWSESALETHTLLMETFQEVGQNAAALDQLKLWLLRNKQTTHWKTTKATAGAIYVLLSQTGAPDLLAEGKMPVLSFKKASNRVNQQILAAAEQDAEPGSGYFKTQWAGTEISPAMGNLTVENPNGQASWGAMYFQYFEELDRIKGFSATPLTLQKKLLRQEMTPSGPQLREILPTTPLKPGDQVVVRIELRADRPMEYLHLKDLRASGLEPVNVLSSYKYQDGLSYYESTGDAATHFFIDYLNPGTYVFEYPLKVVHAGTYSNGNALIQCMYAPEFTSFSAGTTLNIK